MCVNILWWVSVSKAFYRVTAVAAEVCQAAQLCVFILGTGYLSLGVLRPVFGVRYAVNVLVNEKSVSDSKQNTKNLQTSF